MEYDALGRPISTALDGAAGPHPLSLRRGTHPGRRRGPTCSTGSPRSCPGPGPGRWEETGKWRESVAVTNGQGEALYSATRLAQRPLDRRWMARVRRPRGAELRDRSLLSSDALPTALPVGRGPLSASSTTRLGRLVRQTLPTRRARTVDYRAFGDTTTTEGLVAGQHPHRRRREGSSGPSGRSGRPESVERDATTPRAASRSMTPE